MYLSDVLTHTKHMTGVRRRMEDPDCRKWIEPLIRAGGNCYRLEMKCKECPLRRMCSDIKYEMRHFLLRAAARGFKTKTGGIQ